MRSLCHLSLQPCCRHVSEGAHNPQVQLNPHRVAGRDLSSGHLVPVLLAVPNSDAFRDEQPLSRNGILQRPPFLSATSTLPASHGQVSFCALAVQPKRTAGRCESKLVCRWWTIT